MEFKPENVYTALNADESLIGAKGYFANDIKTLSKYVEGKNARNI